MAIYDNPEITPIKDALVAKITEHLECEGEPYTHDKFKAAAVAALTELLDEDKIPFSLDEIAQELADEMACSIPNTFTVN
jgi:hypothetical protein